MSHAFSIDQLNHTLLLKLDSVSFYLEGEEVQRWCNGMFSNNIRKLQPSQGNYSAICDDRGRVQGFLFLYCLRKDRFLCLLDGISLEAFMKRFQMYMILDDIELEETGLQLLHCCGKTTKETLKQNDLSIPERGMIIESPKGFIFPSNRLGLQGYDILYTDPAWPEQLHNVNAISEEDANAIRIFQGRAKWPQDGSEKSMIHELGVNDECCAFDKGCYVGQEIINRLDVKGLITKKIHRLQLIKGEPIMTETELFQGDRKMGRVSSFAIISDSGENTCLGLGTIRKAAWEKGTELVSQGGLVWKVL